MAKFLEGGGDILGNLPPRYSKEFRPLGGEIPRNIASPPGEGEGE